MDFQPAAQFVGRAISGTGKGVAKVVVRTSQLAGRFGRVCALRAQVRRLENRQEDRFERMGRILYQNFLKGQTTEEDLLPLCQEIKSMADEVTQIEQQIAQIQKEPEDSPTPPVN